MGDPLYQYIHKFWFFSAHINKTIGHLVVNTTVAGIAIN